MSFGKPEVDFPRGEPPTELEITDIWEGDGPVANPGDVVKVHYVGVAFSTGEEFDASWDRGEPLQFELGAGRVIAGWDQGVQGMNVGGRRQLIIPPGLAYGDGAPGAWSHRARPSSLCVTWSRSDELPSRTGRLPSVSSSTSTANALSSACMCER